MTYQTPKTNWTTSSIPNPNDFNRIEGNIEDLNTRVGTASQTAQDLANHEVATSGVHGVPEGKTIATTEYVDQQISTAIGGGGGGTQPTPSQIRSDGTLPFVFETRTDDPSNPDTGRAWLRTDLITI